MQPRADHAVLQTPDKWSARLRLDSTYPTPNGKQAYSVTNVPGGFSLMFVAGILSALLGIGSGIIKVLAMDQMMRLPFKVSTTTSNFMIGVTAAASAGVYFHRGLDRSDDRSSRSCSACSAARWLGARILSAREREVAAHPVHDRRRRDGRADALQGHHGGRMTETPTHGSPITPSNSSSGACSRSASPSSAIVVIVGGVLLLAHHGGEVPSYSPFRGEPESIRTLYGIVHGLMAADARSIIQFGLCC